MSRIKLNPKYLETTIEEVKKNTELSNMKKNTIIKCLEMEINRRRNKEENLLYLLEKEVYRIDVNAPNPIIPMIVTEISYNCIVKGDPPVCLIKTLDKDHSKETFYTEIQIGTSLFLTKEEAEKGLKELEKFSSPITHFKEEK